MEIRTDLAMEKINIDSASGIKGVEMTVNQMNGITTRKIKIVNEEGKRSVGKPMGNYITLEMDMDKEGEEEAVKALTLTLRELLDFNFEQRVLVVGLGNRNVTPDSIGPLTIDKIRATRHIFLLLQSEGEEEIANVACLSPGVTGETGVDTLEAVKLTADLVKPDIIIVIDALAAKDMKRINSTIQLSDTGIVPGSGLNNHRKGLTKETLGVKVFSIGVPTVLPHKDELKTIVTTTDIDQRVKSFSKIIARSINNILYPSIYI